MPKSTQGAVCATLLYGAIGRATRTISVFAKDIKGAVTPEFIGLLAAVVILGGAIVGFTRDGQEKVAGDIDVALSAVPVN